MNYNRISVENVKDNVLYIDIPQRYLVNRSICLNVEAIYHAELQGAKIVRVQAGKEVYRSTIENIRRRGLKRDVGFGYHYYVSTKWWDKTIGDPAPTNKSRSKGTNRMNKHGVSKWA
jgi:hypothetical protein